MSVALCVNGCTWREGKVAVSLVHKLEVLCRHFQIRKVVGRDEGICSNLRVLRDLFHAVLQLAGVFLKHLRLNSSFWYVKALWQEKDYWRVVLLCMVRLYTGWLLQWICVPRME